jgi:hypothetical protein
MSRRETDRITLSLIVARSGMERVPMRSGLNWGQRPGRNPNQAYLSVPREIQRSSFLPEIGQQFLVEADDGQRFIMVRAQSNGKALETPGDNSLLGRYFRTRIGVESGRLVTATHLRRYGRTSVDIYRVSSSHYELDFSV